MNAYIRTCSFKLWSKCVI